MTLLVDVGNSAIKWVQLSAKGRLLSAQVQLHRGVDNLAAQLTDRWRGNVTRDAPVVACNVAEAEVVAAVEDAARMSQLQAVRWLRSQRSFDGPIALANGYRNPAQLGADRWHCMLGACSESNPDVTRSLVVVNAGTATTIDCVDAGAEGARQKRFVGKFVGGVIAPGVRLMLESLALRTAGLPNADIGLSEHVADFPDNTEAAIVTGVLDAQAGLVYQIWHRFAKHFKVEPRLILTGGYAEALCARLSMPADIEHNLVLRGLALRAQFDL
ncbi:MAG TPA: type III pantothenate kinase [Burkholderiaceae bacterium]|nr:type III pantothenate kinase [Burkholderiaceae bacterium]